MLKSALELAYAIIANTKHAIAVNPVESPSNPSVRFTALDDAIIIIIISKLYKKLKSKYPFAIKGIVSVEDAKMAVEVGASAVMVSYHGGRQMDGCPAPIEVVGDIVEIIPKLNSAIKELNGYRKIRN